MSSALIGWLIQMEVRQSTFKYNVPKLRYINPFITILIQYIKLNVLRIVNHLRIRWSFEPQKHHLMAEFYSIVYKYIYKILAQYC